MVFLVIRYWGYIASTLLNNIYKIIINHAMERGGDY